MTDVKGDGDPRAAEGAGSLGLVRLRPSQARPFGVSTVLDGEGELNGRMLDCIEIEDGFTVVKMRPPQEAHGFTLEEVDLQDTYGVHVIGVKSPGLDFEYATAQTRVNRDDLLVLTGDSELLDRFAQRP